MPDWTDTLALRQNGQVAGFLAVDLPLEDQDPDLGGPREVSRLAEQLDEELDPTQSSAATASGVALAHAQDEGVSQSAKLADPRNSAETESPKRNR